MEKSKKTTDTSHDNKVVGLQTTPSSTLKQSSDKQQQQQHKQKQNISKLNNFCLYPKSNANKPSSQPSPSISNINNLNSPRLRTRIPIRERSNVSIAPPDNKRFALRKRSNTLAEFNATDKSKINPNASTTTMAPSPRNRVVELSTTRKADKIANETTFVYNQKRFQILKKRLSEMQTEFLTIFKTLKNFQTKINVNKDKELPPDEIKLIAIIANKNGEILLKNSDDLSQILTLPINQQQQQQLEQQTKNSFSFDSSEMIDIKSKLFTINESGFKLCRDFLSDLRSFLKMENNSKEAGDNQDTIQKKIINILTAMDTKISSNLSEQQFKLHSILKEIERYAISQIFVNEENEKKMQKLTEEIMNLQETLKISNSKITELEGSETKTFQKLKLEISTLNRANAEKEEEINKLKSNLENSELKFYDLEKKLKDSSGFNDEKSLLIQKLDLDLKNIQDRTKQYQSLIEEFKTQQKLLSEAKDDYIKKYESEKNLRIDIESQLEYKNDEIENLRKELEKYKFGKSCGDNTDLEKTLLNDLKKKYEVVFKERSDLERERDNLRKLLVDKDEIRLQYHKTNEEIGQLQKTNGWLQERISKLEQVINNKNAIITELEQKIASGSHKTSEREMREELTKLRDIEKQSKKEVDSLKRQIAKHQITIKQQQETMFMNQRLLKIRCELINSLEEKEELNRARLETINPTLNTNTALLEKMNNELAAKAEELQNLFSTLGIKQIELTQQEKMIKMLEDSNDRLQNLRVKHELRIAKQEQEIRTLKAALKVLNNTDFGSSIQNVNSGVNKLI